MHYFGLLGYIAKNGGIDDFSVFTNLKYKAIQLPRGYYTPEKAQKEYKQLCLEKKRYVPSKELVKIGAGSLAAYIQKNGGYYQIREQIGLNFPTLCKITKQQKP